MMKISLVIFELLCVFSVLSNNVERKDASEKSEEKTAFQGIKRFDNCIPVRIDSYGSHEICGAHKIERNNCKQSKCVANYENRNFSTFYGSDISDYCRTFGECFAHESGKTTRVKKIEKSLLDKEDFNEKTYHEHSKNSLQDYNNDIGRKFATSDVVIYKNLTQSLYDTNNTFKSMELKNKLKILNGSMTIIGGDDVAIKDFPYNVVILQNMMALCGGCILTRFHVLTAAHCVVAKTDYVRKMIFMFPIEEFHVRAGSRLCNSGGVVIGVSNIFVHPNYYAQTFDLAVLVLKKPFELSQTIRTVPIATPKQRKTLYDMMRNHSECLVTGWGNTEPYSRSRNTKKMDGIGVVDYLKGLRQPLISWKECSQYIKIDRNSEICTWTKSYSGPCQRDSGSPLVCGGIVYGLVSWGEGCGQPDEPDVYSRLDTASWWIEDMIRSDLKSPLHNKFPLSIYFLIIANFFMEIQSN